MVTTKRAPPIGETITKDEPSTPTSFEEVEAEDELEAEEEEANLMN